MKRGLSMTGEFMSRLKDAIMPLHDEAEKYGPLNAVVAGNVSLDAYQRILQLLYGYVEPAEKAIALQFVQENLPLDYSARKRIPHLVKDLRFFGIASTDLQRIPCCRTLPALDSFDSALGCLYLFEGSRLGGLVIAKALIDKFGFENEQGYAYFGSDGLEVSVFWKSFKAMTENYVKAGGNGPQVISSAQAGFRCLNDWLNQ
jgi:heme oxygenase (biliverdin-IX-beta and delta-forming)